MKLRCFIRRYDHTVSKPSRVEKSSGVGDYHQALVLVGPGRLSLSKKIIPIPIPSQAPSAEQRPIVIREGREPEEEHITSTHEHHEHQGKAHEVVAHKKLAPEERIAEETHEPYDEEINEERSAPEVPEEEEEEEEAAEEQAEEEQRKERIEEKAEAKEIEKEDEEQKLAEEHEEKQRERRVHEAHEGAKEEEHAGEEEEGRKEPVGEPIEKEGEEAEPEVSEPILPPEEEQEPEPLKLPIPLIPPEGLEPKPKIAPEVNCMRFLDGHSYANHENIQDLEPVWPPDEAPLEQPYMNPQYSPEERFSIQDDFAIMKAQVFGNISQSVRDSFSVFTVARIQQSWSVITEDA
ncbi:hypothetical protein Emag_003419 [Eimeria magna]